ncbi:uncharacterized protein elg1 [Lepeophtheirus salmonis]|uniref:uncharacterized protein elg1 n=1 Tax=Lepeophtheirus salmonis TaxID=72036 RepID=UPI001AE37E06|nr:replication factor C subunit 1-like [Lepeophtheirus salmonis]
MNNTTMEINELPLNHGKKTKRIISGFFKRVSTDEYLKDVEKNAAAPLNQTIEALVHPPPSNGMTHTSPHQTSSRRSSNVLISVDDTITVLEEIDGNVSNEKGSIRKSEKRKPREAIDTNSVKNGESHSPPLEPKKDLSSESLSEVSSFENINKLTVKFKKRRKASSDALKTNESDSDIDLNFVEETEQETKSPSPLGIFGVMMSNQKSKRNVSLSLNSVNKTTASIDTYEPNEPIVSIMSVNKEKSTPVSSPHQKHYKKCLNKEIEIAVLQNGDSLSRPSKLFSDDNGNRKQIKDESIIDTDLDFLNDIPKSQNKLKRGRKEKIKIETPSDTIEDKECPRRISSRVKHKRIIIDCQDLSSPEEHELEKNPRKKQKRKIHDKPGCINKMPNKKLASIFVRESPEVTAARKAFLHSQAPERIKKLRDKELSAETIGHDYFNDFSNVLHVNYSSTQYSSDQINIPLRNEDVNVNQILSKDSNLSWLLSRNEEKIEEMTIDDSSGFKSLSLPLDNKHIFLFAHLESTSTRQCFIDLMKRDTSDIDKFPWTLKYAPKRCSHILGNQHTIFSLKVWLKSFSSKIKYSPVYSDTESCSSLSEFGANAAILYGPHGCGKTSTVYALASEFGFNVLEVNASSSRSGRQLTNQTHEATQSHRVGSSKKNKKIGKNHHLKKCSSSNTNNLILIEDIDLFFEDGDEGFYQALSGVIGNSKIPIILTYSSDKHKKSIPLPKVDQLHAYKLSYPPLQVTSRYLCSIALKEGYPVSSRSITEILQKFNGNISKSILELQFLCLSSKQTQSSDHSPILYEMDTSLSEVMNIPMNFQTTDVQTRLHCIIPFKKDNTTSPLCCRSLNYSITDASFSESMEAHNKPRTYSKKDIKEMEYIATRLDIHSGFCEKENSMNSEMSFQTRYIRSVESQILESLYPQNYLKYKFLFTDTLPLIRNMARSEDERRLLNSKRRFLHYLDSQLELSISSEDLLILKNQLNS